MLYDVSHDWQVLPTADAATLAEMLGGDQQLTLAVDWESPGDHPVVGTNRTGSTGGCDWLLSPPGTLWVPGVPNPAKSQILGAESWFVKDGS